MLEILSTGGVNCVQDLGRTGYLDVGVGRSGAMDRPALEAANGLLGNDANAAGLEISLFPFRLRFAADAAFALTGADCPASLDGRPLPGWWAKRAKAGDVLKLDLPRDGVRAYLAFAGGIDVPPVLGSRATDLKSGFGGLDGRGLKRGDRLSLCEPAVRICLPDGGIGFDPTELRGGLPPAGGLVRLRILPSAEFALFTAEARQRFFATEWTVTNDANRMGYRLAGPELALSRPLELFSHGIVPGTVQVPPSGQPIIQLAEANTCGGYPKIANVVEADLWKLAQAPVGARLRFEEVSLEAAVTAIARERAALADMKALAALARRDT
ncbi:MAG: biotin-dependent carboxyltransferase family protein [Shinella sp.]|nr:biotin-dependent carboxyltransferase family protein [Shinella sp.]